MKAACGSARASIRIALLTFFIALLTWNGAFGLIGFGCGGFGLDCIGYTATVLAIGCGAGLLFALYSLSGPPTRPGLKWAGVLLNGLPMGAAMAFWAVIAS